MIGVETTKPPAFDVVVVHSLSHFFRDQLQLEFYVCRLAKNAVRLVLITQELGAGPMSNVIRQIMALFDEYQAHALMLERKVSFPERQAPRCRAPSARRRAMASKKARAEADGDMHSGEHYLTKTFRRRSGGRLHLERSCDLIEVARRLTFRNHVLRVLIGLSALRATLLGLAESHRETAIPGVADPDGCQRHGLRSAAWSWGDCIINTSGFDLR
jgi:hypothetical protein